MTTMEKIRVRFMLVLGIFLALDVGLVAYLIWPGANPTSRRIVEDSLHEQEKLKTRQVAPLKDIDARLAETRENIKKFYADKIPAHWSQISNELSKLAQANGVTLGGVQYTPEDTGLPNVRQVGIQTGVAGDYVKIAQFINAVERDKLLFVIKSVSVRAESQGGGVALTISFETFLQET